MWRGKLTTVPVVVALVVVAGAVLEDDQQDTPRISGNGPHRRGGLAGVESLP